MLNSSQQVSRYLPNSQTRHIISPKLVDQSMIQPQQLIRQSKIEESQSNSNQQSHHLRNVKKLYFLMLIYHAVALLILVQISSLEGFFKQNSYFLFIFLTCCLLLSLLSLSTHNILIYLAFTIMFLFLFFSIKAILNTNLALMILFMFGGQVLAQFINVLQVNSEKELYFHQQSLFALCSGLIVFQIFISSEDIQFFQMILILASGILFGFLLIISTQSIESKLEGNEIMESVSIYCDVLVQFLHVNQNIAKLYSKDQIEVDIQLIGRNTRFGDDFRKISMGEAKTYQHILISKLKGGDGLIGLKDGMFAYRKGRTQYVENETEECSLIAIMRVE